MTVMPRRLVLVTLALGVVLALLGAGCRGGSDSEKDAGTGERITDPARVPSSTPVQNPILFQIKQDGNVSFSGGPTTTVAAGTPQANGTGAKSTYAVQAGDTCGAIASKFGITLDELRKANRTINSGCTNLHEGDVLRIPSAAPTAAATAPASSGTPKPGANGKTHTVADGQTCEGIAGGYGVKVSDLIAANNLDPDCRNLKIGQVLKIPG